jgi:hypothetical protein
MGVIGVRVAVVADVTGDAVSKNQGSPSHHCNREKAVRQALLSPKKAVS